MKSFPVGILMSSLSLLAGCSTTPATEKQRPAIDLAAPAKTETATFALG